MSCTETIALDLPTLPSPFTLGATLPTVSLDPALCCKLLDAPVDSPPIPLPPLILNAAYVAVLNAARDAIVEYTRTLALRIECPRE